MPLNELAMWILLGAGFMALYDIIATRDEELQKKQDEWKEFMQAPLKRRDKKHDDD